MSSASSNLVMKLSAVVTFATLWPLAVGFGFRGAAERSMLFAGYLAEEVWTDESKLTIAKGCVGDREGLRGQKNRCNLKQFIRHVWEQTKGEVTNQYGAPVKDENDKKVFAYDTEPLKADVDSFFTKSANRKALNPDLTQVYQMAEVVNKYKVPRVPNVAPAGGFTGNLRTAGVWPNMDYYQVMEKFGANMIVTKKEIEEKLGMDPAPDNAETKPDEITKKKQEYLKKWHSQLKIGVMQAQVHRQMDDARHKHPGIKEYFEPPLKKEYYAHKTASQPIVKDHNDKIFDFRLNPWEEPDREAIIQNAVAGGVDGTDAATAYDEAVGRFYSTPEGVKHKIALDGIAASAAAMGC